MKTFKSLAWLVFMGLTWYFAGCLSVRAQESQLTLDRVEHHPLHPANNQAVTFVAVMQSGSGLARAELLLSEYEMYSTPEGRAVRRRAGGQWGVVKTWPAQPAHQAVELSFLLPSGFGRHSFIQYEFVLYGAVGNVTRQTVSFQAGDSPYGEEEILLYSTSPDAPVNTIDVCMLPDKQGYKGKTPVFLADLETTIYQGYLANSMIKDYKQEWAFYYSPATANASIRKLASLPKAIRASSRIDVFGIIHKRKVTEGGKSKPFRDARKGRVFSSEYYNVGTVVHETAHAVFNLSDEYPDSYVIDAACNVYSTERACEQANSGLPCRSFREKKTGKTFHSLDSKSNNPQHPKCIMHVDGDKDMPDFGANCQACILAHYRALNATRRAPATQSNKQILAVFHTEKVLVLKITATKANWRAQVLRVTYGSPTQVLPGAQAVNVTAQNAQGKSVFEVSVGDPRLSYIDDNSSEAVEQISATGAFFLAIPFDPAIRTEVV